MHSAPTIGSLCVPRRYLAPLCQRRLWHANLLYVVILLVNVMEVVPQQSPPPGPGRWLRATAHQDALPRSAQVPSESGTSALNRKLHHTRFPHHRQGSRTNRPRALVSLLVNTAQHDYVQGATVLAKSALHYAPDYFSARVLLVLNGRKYSSRVLQQAQSAGWILKWVDPITPPHPSKFPRFVDQFAKLHLWNMVEYKQVVYMDLDVAFVAPLKSNFISPHAYPTNCKLWAARDIWQGVWRDGFNMGVAGLMPNATEFTRLMDLVMNDKVKYNHWESEQGFLNKVYTQANGGWCELDFELNANLAAYQQLPDYWASTTPQVVHYTLRKPWDCGFEFRHICNSWDTLMQSAIYPVTVVTAYFSMGRNNEADANSSRVDETLIANEMPMVVFTDDPEAVPGLKERDPKITKILLQQTADFTMSSKMFDWDRQLSLDPDRDIHEVVSFKLALEKANWMMAASDMNPFESQVFVWADFDSFESGNWSDTWVALAERFPFNEHQLLMSQFPEQYTSNPKRVGGRVFGGSKLAWRLWSTAFYNSVRRLSREGAFVGDEEAVMTLVASQHPQLTCVMHSESSIVDQGHDTRLFLLWYLAGKAPMQECSTAQH